MKQNTTFSKRSNYWVHDRNCNVSFSMYFEGANFSIDNMKSAIDLLILRHELMRTSFKTHENKIELIRNIKNEVSIELSVQDIKEKDIIEYIKSHANCPIDIIDDFLIKFSILRINKSKHIMVVCIHKIISDSLSINIIIRDLRELYYSISNNKKDKLPPLIFQYSDYVAIEQKKLS